MEQVGLSGRLEFEEGAAVRSINRASGAFKNLRISANTAKQGVQNVSAGLAISRVQIAAVSAAGGVAVKKFADFEGQFGAVKAVLGEAQAESFPALRAEALRLGATTAFTAKQSAEAMENLARAGLEPKRILSSIGPVLNAAAAEGMDLGTAADIVASNMKAFGLSAKDATRIADTLAFVSAKTNTNMVGLQEGLKFVGPVARSLKIPLEDTAASLGILADVGLKGSLAGTGLKNALLKISAASKNGVVKIGKYRVAIARTTSGGVDLAGTMANIVTALQNMKSPMDKSNAAMKLLGLRGLGAATAFEALDKKKAGVLFDGLQKTAKGASAEMARMRLDNIHGDFVRLSSAIDGAAIAIGKELAPIIQPLTKRFTEFVSSAQKGTSGFMTSLKEGISSAAGIIKGVFGEIKTVLDSFGITLGGVIKTGLKFGAVALSAKVLIGTIRRLGLVAKGTFQILKGGLGFAKTGIVGAVSFLSSKFPRLARILPGGLSKLTSAVSAAEKITAQPVRVVNFDEAGGIGGTAATGSAAAQAAGGAAGWLDKAGKVALAGAIGVAIGRYIDEKFKLSDKISDSFVALDRAKATIRAAKHEQKGIGVASAGIVNQLIALRGRGKTVSLGQGQPRQEITRELALSRVRASLALRLKDRTDATEQTARILAELKPLLEKLPSAVQAGVANATISVSATDVHKGVKRKQQEADSRLGRAKLGQAPRAIRGT